MTPPSITLRVLIRNDPTRTEGHLLIDNDEEVIRTLNSNFTLIQKHDGTNQVDILKAANTRIDRRYRNLPLKINESISDIVAELGDIQYDCLGYRLNRNEVQNKIIFAASIIFKKFQAKKQSKDTCLEKSLSKLQSN